jgi:hypothetical protein
LNRPDRIEALAARYLNTMTPVTPDNLLVNARAVPEPQMMQDEDGSPVLVSTADAVGDFGRAPVEPSARPIRDADDVRSGDFNGVLKNATGDDE